MQLSRDLGITQKSAWFMLHRIREMLREKRCVVLQNIVEVDETFVGGKNKNRHHDKKVKYLRGQGRDMKDKTPVVGLLERGGPLITFVTPNTKEKVLTQILLNNVDHRATIVSDAYNSYMTLGAYFDKHVMVKKYGEGGFYVQDKIYHTQGIEGFWSILKRGIIGIYHYVSKKHLQRYCDEFTYRYNTVHFTNAARFENAQRQCAGRLKYKDLILDNG